MAYFRCGGGGLPKTLIYDGVLPDAFTNVNITIPAGTKALALIVTNQDNGHILQGDSLIYDINRNFAAYSQQYYDEGNTSKYLAININVPGHYLRLSGGNNITMTNVPVKLYAVDLSPADF